MVGGSNIYGGVFYQMYLVPHLTDTLNTFVVAMHK